MKKFLLLGAAVVLSALTAFSQDCQDNNGLALGSAPAPCANPGPVSVDFFAFEVWRGDQYTWSNVKANGAYTFDICQGTGGTAWDASFTVVDPLGAVIASGVDIDGCSIDFTATVDGDYDIYIIEVGICPPVVLTAAGVDNGLPRLTYNGGGNCDPPVTTCDSGTNDGVTDSEICPDETTTVSFSNVIIPNSPTQGAIAVEFTPVDPANPTGVTVAITLTGAPGGAVSYEFGNDPEGILFDNNLPDFVGEFNVKLVSTSDAALSPFDPANRCDSTDVVVVDFLPLGAPGCAPAPICEAGDVADTSPQTVCPGDDVVLELTGEEFSDAANILLVWVFIDTITPDSVFVLPLEPTSPATYNFTGDLNAELSLAGLPTVPPGTYEVFAGVFDTNSGYCDFTDNEFFLTVLDENDPACIPECAIPYPQVANNSTTLVQNSNGGLTYSWDPIPGQIGCVVNVRVGDPALPTAQGTFIVGGPTASTFTVGAGPLAPFALNTINFRVRCGCRAQNPTIAGPFTQISSILYIPGAGIAEQTSLPVDRKAYKTLRSENKKPSFIELASPGDLSDVPAYTGRVADSHPAMQDIARNVKVVRNDASFEVFPNPSTGLVNLNYDAQGEGFVNVRVFDLLGKAVGDFNMSIIGGTNFLNLDLSSFEKGMYIIELREGENSATSKVVLK